MKNGKFDTRDITILDTITAIRSRPQMYIGDVSGRGIINILL